MSPKPEKCRKCGEPATHKITKIVKGKTHNIFLCDEHAQDFSPYLQVGKPQPSQLLELLQQVLQQQEKMIEETDDDEVFGEGVEARACPNCGLQFSAYRKTLLLGCSDCYQAFEDLLLDDLRKIHGAVSQTPQWAEQKKAIEKAMAMEGAAPLSQAVEPDAEDPEDVDPEAALQIGDLRLLLEKAIDVEDFQEAARLRDRILEREKAIQNDEEQDI